MMGNERLKRIRADLQRASTVLYLEGVTDPLVLFALLGRARPKSDIYQDTWVVGLKSHGSGGTEVRALVEVAEKNGLAGSPGGGGVFGIIDGDGRSLDVLAGEFDAPHVGPLFSWKGYCIENLLARAFWPAAWGVAPNWPAVLADYASYSALNRVHVQLRTALETLGLARFTNPQLGQPLLADEDIKTALRKDKHLIEGRDVEAMFDAEVTVVRAAVAASLDDGHAIVNGKWIMRHYARSVTDKSEEQCRDEWCEVVRTAGGLHEVRDLWHRITGKAP